MKLKLLAYPWRTYEDDTSAALGLLVARKNKVLVTLLGFGWDPDHPLRPWPRFTTEPTPRGNAGFCASCCGVFVNVRWRSSGG